MTGSLPQARPFGHLPPRAACRRAWRAAAVAACLVAGGLVAGGGTAWAAAPEAAPGTDAASEALAALGKGAVALRAGELPAACAWFGRAARLTPAWAMAQLELGRCLRLLGDPTGAAAGHLQAAGQELRDRPAVPLEQGLLAEEAGRPEAAREAYARVLELAPAEVRASAGLARVSEPGAPALEALRRLVDRRPGEVAAWRALAEAAEAAGRLDEAEEALGRALELSASPALAAAALGRFGARTGRATAVRRAARALGR